MLRSRSSVAAVLVLFLSAGSLIAAQTLVVDTDGRALVRVDLATGTVGEKLQLPMKPYKVLRSPDGKRVIVFNRGEGQTAFWTGKFKPTGKSSLAVVDTATMKDLGRIELGWDLDDTMFAPDGMLYVLTPGFAGNEILPAELIKIDPAAATVVKRVTFERPAEGFDIAGDGKTAVVFFTGNANQELPAEFRFVDLPAMSAGDPVKLTAGAASPFASASQPYVYALDRGGEGAGQLFVLSTADHSVKSLEVGREPAVALVDGDGGRVFVVSRPDGGKGQLQVIRGAGVEQTVPLEFAAQRVLLRPDGRTAYVVGNNVNDLRPRTWVSRVDLVAGKASAKIEFSATRVRALVVSADDSRLVMMHANEKFCCSASVTDLTAGKNLTNVLTGSRGKRVLSGLGAAAMSVASYQAGKSSAVQHGRSSFTYSTYSPKTQRAARGPLAIRPDGKFAYALDAQTDYLTVLDLSTGEKVANLPAGDGVKEVVLLGDGNTLAVVADDVVTLVDTQKNEKSGEVKLSGDVRDFAVMPDGKYAVVLGKQKLVVLDAQTGKVVTDVTSLAGPTQLVPLD